ncbi:hypothetical protein LCGC14_1164710 [marine sediment metagenome]|uniref:Uncharacterized protein n=1 Tax=marine sediment metagenome TaxID=412755 RepID=A0A0F9MEK9_9ZZZZ
MKDQMNCICCDKEQEVLISVEMKADSIFLHRRGICQSCLKDKDVNKVCKEYEIKKTEQSIEESEIGLGSLKEHLIKLREAEGVRT